MTIQFENQLDINKTWENIQKKIQDQQENYRLWKIVESVLTRFEGQKITKRIETALKKELPEYTIYYVLEYGMYHVRIWGNGIQYDQRKGYLIGYSTNSRVYDAVVNMDVVRSNNQCWELEKSRSEKLQTLTRDQLFFQVEKWNTGLQAMQEVNKWSEFYEMNYNNIGFDVNSR